MLYEDGFNANILRKGFLIDMESQSAMKCVNGCGFYGNSNYEGMCSKCFKEKLKRQMSTSHPSILLHSNGTVESQLANLSVTEQVKEPSHSSDVVKTIEESLDSSDAEAPLEKKHNKCLVCKRRVGLTGFMCRCGGPYCGLHRYSDTHPCTFDYKERAREELQKANPTIMSSKIHKI